MEWIGLIGVAVGALLAGVIGWLTLRFQLSHQESRDRKKLFLDKLQELYEEVSQFKGSYARLSVLQVDSVVNRKPLDDFPPVPIERLQMLVGFYAPSLEPELRKLMERREEFSYVFAKGLGLEQSSKDLVKTFLGELRAVSLALNKSCQEMQAAIVRLSKDYI